MSERKMNRKEEKRRKFHEGLLKLLYPPPSLPHNHQATESSEEAASIIDLDLVPDESDNERRSSSSSDGDMGFDARKLTRAQRKRIRRAKLKEAASRRRKIIGPLLPEATDDIGVSGAEIVEEHPPCVRQNASSPVYCLPEEAAQCTMKKNKFKKRRACKKLGSASSNIIGHAK